VNDAPPGVQEHVTVPWCHVVAAFDHEASIDDDICAPLSLGGDQHPAADHDPSRPVSRVD
jgi:hypothetical protein